MSEGGTKHDDGKLQFGLLPVEPLREVVYVYGVGAKKYGVNEWRKGIAYSRIFNAMMRHAWSWWNGERNDPEDGQHHLSSVAWGALTLMWYELFRPTFDDRYVLSTETWTPTYVTEDSAREEACRAAFEAARVEHQPAAKVPLS